MAIITGKVQMYETKTKTLNVGEPFDTRINLRNDMKTLDIDTLLEFIDDQLLYDKLHYFLRNRKDFTYEEADKAFKEWEIDYENN